MSCAGPRGDVVEFGCGYGTFTVSAASQIKGSVFAMDIDPAMIAATALKVAAKRTVDGYSAAARTMPRLGGECWLRVRQK